MNENDFVKLMRSNGNDLVVRPSQVGCVEVLAMEQIDEPENPLCMLILVTGHRIVVCGGFKEVCSKLGIA